MTDIVDRLRHCSENCGDEYLHELAGKAADEIDRLRAALRQGVYEATHLSPENEDGSHWAKISRAWLEQARAALGEKE